MKYLWLNYNRPFPRSLVPLFQNESKCKTFHNYYMKMSSTCSFIFMQINVIFIRMVSHLDSLWNRGTGGLGNGLFQSALDQRNSTLTQLSPRLEVMAKSEVYQLTSFLRGQPHVTVCLWFLPSPISSDLQTSLQTWAIKVIWKPEVLHLLKESCKGQEAVVHLVHFTCRHKKLKSTFLFMALHATIGALSF